MKKIVFFYTAWTDAGERLLEAAQKRKKEAVLLPVHYSQVVFEGKPGEISLSSAGFDLGQASLFYFRSVGDHNEALPFLLDYAQEKQIPVVDSYLLKRGGAWRKKKSTEAVTLLKKGVSYPPSLFVSGREELKKMVKKRGLPLILKSTQGRHGVGTFLIRKEEELARVLRGRERTNFLLQQFIVNDGDYRLFLVGYRVVAGFKRQRKEEKLILNRSQGASSSLEKIPADLAAEAEKAARVLGVEIAGVDCVREEKSGRPVVVEVNQAPEFLVMEKKSGRDIAAMIIDYLIKKSR